MTFRNWILVALIAPAPLAATAGESPIDSAKIEILAQSGNAADLFASACSAYERDFGAHVASTISMIVTVNSANGDSVTVRGRCPVEGTKT